MNDRFPFSILAHDAETGARRGTLTTTHGVVQTPVFMPVGTQGAVKAVLPRDLLEMGAEVILGNTYHLMLRPGTEAVAAHGGLHAFAGWPRAMLTDSGGFQVFSLGGLNRITEEGVTFQSHLDGARHELTPERSMAVQEGLGADIAMAFDECPPSTAPRDAVAAATERTTRWADRSLAAHTRPDQALFGIVQGGLHEDLRAAHAEELAQRPFDGMAIGGLSVGEAPEEMWAMTAFVAPKLPERRPRYLMGVGTPEDLVRCVGHGVDMFDCVLPTRCARNGLLFTRTGRISIKQAAYRDDREPLDAQCRCYTCRTYTRAYLRHLYVAREVGAAMLNTLHNLTFYMDLMQAAREAIEDGRYGAFQRSFLAGEGFPRGRSKAADATGAERDKPANIEGSGSGAKD